MRRITSILTAVVIIAMVIALHPPQASAATTIHVRTSSQSQPIVARPADLRKNICTAAPLIPGGLSACIGTSVAAPLVDKAVDAALDSTILQPMATAMGELTGSVLRTGLSWWLQTPSVRIEQSGVAATTSDGQPVTAFTTPLSLQSVCLLVGYFLAVVLTLLAAVRTMVQRRGVHLATAVQGLLVDGLVCLMGFAVIDSLLAASDTLTTAILQVGFDGDSDITDHIVKVMVNTSWNPMMLLVLAGIGLLVGLYQLVMLFLRQAAIPIQALLLPIAGAGQIGGDRTRQWLPRLYSSIFTVIAYKPAAALILSVGFVELQGGASLLDWIRGIVTLVLSAFALHGLMHLFTPLGESLAGATAGGFGRAVSDAAVGLSLLRGPGGSRGDADPDPAGDGITATRHAQQMARTGPAATSSAAGTGTGSAAAGAGAIHPVAAAALAIVGAAKSGVDTAAAAMSGRAGPSDSGSPMPPDRGPSADGTPAAQQAPAATDGGGPGGPAPFDPPPQPGTDDDGPASPPGPPPGPGNPPGVLGLPTTSVPPPTSVPPRTSDDDADWYSPPRVPPPPPPVMTSGPFADDEGWTRPPRIGPGTPQGPEEEGR